MIDTKQNILFIALNGHQRCYFNAVRKYLERSYNVFLVNYPLVSLTDLLFKQELPAELEYNTEEIDRMIEFLRIKAEYRDFGIVRRFLHSRYVLTNQAHSSINFFYKYIEANNIDLICVWNGTLVPLAAAASVARKLNRKTLFFENGYLPNTTTVDPVGVNNNNSLVGKPREFYDKVEVDEGKLADLYSERPAIRALKSKWYQRIFKKAPKGEAEKIELPDKYLFLPFQVHDDTQVLLHSPWVKTMADLTAAAVAAVKNHNQLNNDNLKLIIKEHPSDFGRVDYSSLKQKFQSEDVIFLRYYPTPELIKKAQGVITINSSVGIEALVQHKPVITLGKAFYNVPGIVINVKRPEDIAASIAAVNNEVNHALIDKFLYYLRYYYLAQGSWRQPDNEHFESVRGKVAELLKS